jgi:hypothetical protein
MPNSGYGPQEDAYTLFLEKTFMLSTFVGAIGYGAPSFLARKTVIDWFSRNRRATCNVFHLRLIFVEATQFSRKTCILPSRVHIRAPYARVRGHELLHLGACNHVHQQSRLPWRADGMVFGLGESTIRCYILCIALCIDFPIGFACGQYSHPLFVAGFLLILSSGVVGLSGVLQGS